ncbi:MAG: hypothetical protein ACE5J5_04245 [Candidatus Hydrothermarchaeales archaeon]
MTDTELKREKANMWAFIAWVLGILGFIVVYSLRYEDDFAVFHAKQSFVLSFINIIILGMSWAFSMVPGIGILIRVLSVIVQGLTIIITIAGAYFSLKGIRYRFLIIYTYSEKLSL